MIDNLESQNQADSRVIPALYNGCPYFGLPDDPETRIMFPIEGAFCHKARPAGEVELTYQQRTCLTGQHPSCSVFLQQQAGPLPPEISGLERGYRQSHRVFYGVLVILLFAVVGIVAGLWWSQNSAELDALIPVSGTDVPVIASTPADVALLAATDVPTPTPTPTNAPTMTAAPPTATATTTPTSEPTATARPLLPPTFTPPSPTDTPEPTVTAVNPATAVIDVNQLNVREGPGVDYPTLGLLPFGLELEVVGQFDDGSWLLICCIDGDEGWLFANAVALSGNVAAVPIIVDFPPLPSSEP